MKLRCLFGHEWGPPQNLRQPPAGLDDLLFPFPVQQVSLSANPIGDRTCQRCGVTRTFECARQSGLKRQPERVPQPNLALELGRSPQPNLASQCRTDQGSETEIPVATAEEPCEQFNDVHHAMNV